MVISYNLLDVRIDIMTVNKTCRYCLYASLIRYGNNPIIAECHKKPQPGNDKFPYERMVASSQVCNEWKQDASDKVIKQVA